MTATDTSNRHGRLVSPDTLQIERLLPGPIERIWSWLTQDDLRRKWLAAGEMPLTTGAEFELTWRNDDLTTPPGARPEGFGAEHRMTSRIIAANPPGHLAFTWGSNGEVEITLAPSGDMVLLTLTHRRTADRAMRVMVGAGWHAHLDLLAARLEGSPPEAFWDAWQRLRADYEARSPA
ncbi:MAG: ATPase [Alphaproteobacteria bacterium HGW-Alphaproteobacteria-6]|nr:MAG: ATPase [Alphaproteobacteria bacterium HGW-Alphaproteobacteria-6]